MVTNFVSGTDRQLQILQLVERQQRISVANICATFEVSEATARRDLEALAAEGKIQRVHGGAIALMKAPPEQPILQRQDEQAQEKIRIGLAAAASSRMEKQSSSAREPPCSKWLAIYAAGTT